MNESEFKAELEVLSREELIVIILVMVQMNLRHLQAEIMIELQQLKGETLQ